MSDHLYRVKRGRWNQLYWDLRIAFVRFLGREKKFEIKAK